MKINARVAINLKDKEVQNEVNKAAESSLLDTVVDIANYVIKKSPKLTGHNMRSIAYQVGSKNVKTGSPKSGEKPFNEYSFSLKSLEGAIYSTSGYGGYLETGTSRMEARPYFKPALDRNIGKLAGGIKARLR